MKQLFLNLKNGAVTVEDVPPPVLREKGVLVENHFSVVSGGSEKALLDLARASYLGKARKKPDLFRKVVEKAKKEGVLAAYEQAMGRLNTPEPLGYSCAGVVSQVSPGVPFAVGDRVACGGLGYANHADMVFVPRNLCVKVPEKVSLRDAAFTTLGAIALQGVRNAEVQVGETVAVIGLGLVGQLTVQILKASGCRVFGVDIDGKKVSLSKTLGLDEGGVRSAGNIEEQINGFSRGHGCDAVIICAATSSQDPLAFAGAIARHRGRVVLVGVVGMDLPRDVYYAKELRFVVSRSYGPGRYDHEYEELGHDYPVGYVRWTEQRNMEAFLDLVAEGAIRFDELVSHEFPIEEGVKAYQLIMGETQEPYLGVVLQYSTRKEKQERITLKTGQPTPHGGHVGIGVIGAGQFATAVLLPALQKVSHVHLVGLAAASGLSVKSAGERFGFAYATTEYQKILEDPQVNAVIIATRNSLHARLAVEALHQGKHVFVEKPLAVTLAELDNIVRAHQEHPELVLQVGFNRRYAPLTRKIKGFLEGRQGPLVMIYRVNAEHLPPDHWVYDDGEGGSRLITEVCHFVDFCRFVVGTGIEESSIVRVRSPSMSEKETRENMVLTLRFTDGSVATVVYNTIADPGFSKEYVEIFAENALVRLTDFKELVMSRRGRVTKMRHRLKTEKGHKEELEHFVSMIRMGKRSSIDDVVEVTRVTLP